MTSSPSFRTGPPHFGQAQGRGIDDPLARQVLGQRPAGRLAGAAADAAAAPLGCRELGRRLFFGRALLELGELQLELLDELGAALGRAAELRAARLGEQQLEALDLEPEGGDLVELVRECGVPFGELRLGGLPCRALGTQHRVRRGEVVGQGSGPFTQPRFKHMAGDLSARSDPTRSHRRPQLSPPLPVSRSVCGIRQSIPSSK